MLSSCWSRGGHPTRFKVAAMWQMLGSSTLNSLKNLGIRNLQCVLLPSRALRQCWRKQAPASEPFKLSSHLKHLKGSFGPRPHLQPLRDPVCSL